MAKMKWITEEDLLTESKEQKKRELSQACQDDIMKGFYVTINASLYRISYDREAQVNISERWTLFQDNMINSIIISAHETETDNPVRVQLDKTNYERLYIESVKAKEDKISRLKDILYPMVEQAFTEEQISLIKWDNDIVEPIEPTIDINTDNTVGKQLIGINNQLASTDQELSFTSGALFELYGLFM